MKESAQVTVDVYNTVGQLVKSSKTTAQSGSNALPIDISHLETGIYMVNIKAGNAVSTKKLIVQ
jgi:hypothetical protein